MTRAAFSAVLKDGELQLHIKGDWTLASQPLALDPILTQLDAAVHRLVFDSTDLGEWGSLLVSVVLVLQRTCLQRGIAFDSAGLPAGVQPLLALANVAPAEPSAKETVMGFAESWRMLGQRGWQALRDPLIFGGELVLSCSRLLRGRANWRLRDFWYFVEQAGPGAFGIISLVSLLAGVILAYLGAVQLKQFGAQVYVANLVSIGITREMGALMTAIIMAGRTGAAYAAQLGTMQANEEIDALETMGINPIDFLVLPRILSLVLVLPLLTVYSDVLGMLGGALIAGSMDIGLAQYFLQAQESITVLEVVDGLFKSLVFAVLIAQAGCYWGLRSGRSSNDVGFATTRAVVTALVAIIVADSVINVIYDKLGV
jgi:phospholipid/cholesterol/gamma-HCH transport system permease protein